MSDNRFPLYLKSTLDKLLNGIGTTWSLPVVDVDSAAMFADLLESDQAAIVWAVGSISEVPMDPLWAIDFDVGIKTSLDPAQYQSMELSSALSTALAPGSQISVFDYTGTTAGTALQGQLYITSAVMQPSQPDRLFGIRMLNVQGKAVRN